MMIAFVFVVGTMSCCAAVVVGSCEHMTCTCVKSKRANKHGDGALNRMMR
jgi:hypothetical protein